MNPPLNEGVREKLRRAHLHREDLERRVERFINTQPYGVITYDDAQTGRRIRKVVVRREPPRDRWGALIGDCLFNFRSALDHLAYDLAVAYSGYPLKPAVESSSEFPIFWRRAPKPRELDTKIGAIDPKARALIEKMQPYGRKDRAALKYLDKLQNFDKHRTLHLVGGTVTGVAAWGVAASGKVPDDPLAGFKIRPFRNGDVLSEGPIMENDAYISFGVAFNQSGPGAGYEVRFLLNWIGEHIEKGVIEPLLEYL